MGNGGTAGGSATRQAARLRQRAERYEQGARGEALTATILGPLAARGFLVFHDIAVPGSRAQVDHVVIGPTGVFAVDSKLYRARLSFNKDTLWAGKHPQTNKLETTKWEAGRVGDMLAHPGVVAVQCVHGTTVPALPGPVQDVHVVDPNRLVSLIADGPDTLTPNEVAAVAAKALGQWQSAPAASAPAVLPPRPLPPAPRRRSASRRRKPSLLQQLIVILVTVVASYLALQVVLTMFANSVKSLTTTTTTTARP